MSVCLSYHNSLLHPEDVDLLRGPFWLNDLLISFYLEYLEHDLFRAHSERLLFVSPEVTQCMKLVSASETSIFLDPLGAACKPFIFFPINDHQQSDTVGGSHWSLLVFSRPDQRFYSADSAGASNRRATLTFVQNVHGALETGAESQQQQPMVQPLRCVQQANGYDCGVHVLWNVTRLARHAMETGSLRTADETDEATSSSSSSVGEMRGQMLKLIERLAAADGTD